MSVRHLAVVALICTLLAACGVGTVAPAPTRLDLGVAPVGQLASPQIQPIALPVFSAASILHDQRVIWRMGPNGQPNSYSTYLWASPPAVLVRERLFERLSLSGPVLTQDVNAEMAQLRVTLMQFEQIYSPDGQSNEAVIALQGVLVQDGKVKGRLLVNERQLAKGNTAPAGAQALRIATDKAVQKLAQWTVLQLK